MPEEKKSPYQFYGAPMYDPRKENRVFLKPTSQKKHDINKIKEFVEAALLGNATVIEIRDPTRSGREGEYELYSDASIGDETFHDILKLKGRRKRAGKK